MLSEGDAGRAGAKLDAHPVNAGTVKAGALKASAVSFPVMARDHAFVVCNKVT
jgi:hypothetical protein